MFTLLYKIFKALNSSQKEYQLALALVLALFSGLLPFFSLINLVIIFIVFTINIPIGLYGAFALIFSLLGSIIDPLLHDFGQTILTTPSLDGFFTSLYNNPVALWFNFNHTITMGGFVSALLLALPVYFLSKILFKKYRVTFEKYFKNSKVFSWLNPYDEKKTAKKQAFLRWWGAGLFLLISGLIISFVLLFLDPIIKFSLEYTISKVTKSSFIINDLHTDFSKTNIVLKDISFIKHNEKHSIDSIIIDFDLDNLLRKKVDIKDILVKNLHLNQKFTPQKETTNPKDTKSGDDKKIDFNLDLPDIDSILSKENLKSVHEAKEIKQRYKDINVYWKNAKKEKLNKSRLQSIETKYKEIEKLSKNIKSLNDIQLIAKKSKELQQEIKEIRNDYKKLKTKYQNDKKTIKNDVKLIKQLPQDDYNYLINKYQLNSNGALNVVETYISDDLAEYSRIALEYYKLVKPYLPKSAEDEIIVVRKKGIWIKYKENNPFPDFAIEHFYINLINSKAKEVALQGNYINKLKMQFIVKEFKLKKFKIAKDLYLDTSMIDSTTDILFDDYRYANISSLSNFTKARFDKHNAKSKTDKIIQSILSKIDTFYIDTKTNVDTKSENLGNIKIKSDLNGKLKKAFNTELSKQKKIYKEKLKQKIKEKLKKKLGDLDDSDFNKIEQILKSNDLKNGNFSQLIKKNFATDEMKQKLKKKAQEKAKAKLEKEKQKAKVKAKEKLDREKKKLEENLKNKLKSLF